MKSEIKLPNPIEAFIRAINVRDANAFSCCFSPDAVVKDFGREICGTKAIQEWGEREVFAVNVTLEVMSAAERAGQTIVTVKVDGTFDRTGLPNPLIMEHCYKVTADKITELTCQLAVNS